VGAVPASRLVSAGVDELYDYDELRSIKEATMFAVSIDEPLLVLGSSQTADVLDRERVHSLSVRRRRGGGGIVYLDPADIWIDWWIPADDERWERDVRSSARRAGGWWRDALAQHVTGALEVYDGPLVGEEQHRVVCFAGRGPGEVFVDGVKAVGLAQWRVHEGSLLTSVLPANSSALVVDLLAQEPQGLREALAHHSLSSLALEEPELVADLARQDGPWQLRQPPFLT
jgi:lipoate-protein ligase A